MYRTCTRPVPALVAGLTLALVLAHPESARATYSIAATDEESQQVGGAAITCLDGNGTVAGVYGSAVGDGVVAAQALVDQERRGRERAVQRLEEGVAPDEIIAEITDPTFDFRAEERQYGIADLEGRAAGFTGSQTGDHASDRQGQTGPFTYSVQGNLLTSEAVIAQSEDGFQDGGCDLADRLIRGLEAGAEGGEGDNRCTDDGYPGDTAFLQVDRPGEPAGSWLQIEVESVSGRDALPVLRQEYDAWRADNPCPSPDPDAGISADAGAPADAGSPDNDVDADADGNGDGNGHGNGNGGGCAALPASPGSGAPLLLAAALGLLLLRSNRYRQH